MRKIMKTAISLAMISILALSATACGQATAGTAAVETTASAAETDDADIQAASAAPVSDEPLVMVWYPNESASDYAGARDEYARLVQQATGRTVEQRLTTDYSIAIESIAGGTAHICFMGAQGYVEAKNKNQAVLPLFVNSGASGTLDDAIYYSFLAVKEADQAEYASLDSLEGKRMSFVSNSSTSGFKVPTSSIITHFIQTEKWKNMSVDDLIEGDGFFSEVLFGGSHQGAAVNLLTDKADVAAFCDTEIAPYASVVSGEENKTGSIYAIKDGASAPFDTMIGEKFAIMSHIPVLNGPFVYNSEALSPEEVQKIQELFLSDEVANNNKIFVNPDSGDVGMFKKTDKERFLMVEDSWYDPIREMSR